MNTLVNKVQLIGRLGNDPKVQEFNNVKRAAINLATNEVYKNAKGERVQNTTWHNVVAWRKTADLIEKLCKKGKEVAIEGKLVQRSYTDKNDQKKFVTEIVATKMVLLGSK